MAATLWSQSAIRYDSDVLKITGKDGKGKDGKGKKGKGKDGKGRS